MAVKYVYGITPYQKLRLERHKERTGLGVKDTLDKAIDAYLDFIDVGKNNPDNKMTLSVIDEQGQVRKTFR